MNQRILLIVTIVLLALPAAGLAMQDMDSDGDGMEMEHAGMNMTENMIMLGSAAQAGVKAMVHAQVYDEAARAALAKMGQEGTHHFMVMFTDQQSGEMISEGRVAVRVRPAEGEWSSPVQLMPMKMAMGNGFGADIKLAAGTYQFNIGTLMADGQKRIFRMQSSIK